MNSLGKSRFLKTIKGKYNQQLVILKIYVKPDLQIPIDQEIQKLQNLKKELQDVPNTLTFHQLLETDKFLASIRQYLYSNLYDRISTRPFLNPLEKKWITFQLLTTLQECHRRNIYHLDLKSENILVTSWNWVYICDFAMYKPIWLPDDDPALYGYFFDSSLRRSCYIAPERFDTQKYKNSGSSTGSSSSSNYAKMDIFSLGCVLAELFLEGQPIFNFSQLLRYKKNEYNPLPELQKIEDPNIRDMIRHMIQINPDKRMTAEEYLLEWRSSWPVFFGSFLYHYFVHLLDPYSVGSGSDEEEESFGSVSDYYISRLLNDFDKISYFLGFTSDTTTIDTTNNTAAATTAEITTTTTDNRLTIQNSNMYKLAIPNYPSQLPTPKNPNENGTLLLSFLLSHLRNITNPSLKLKSLDLLLAISLYIPDVYKLDRTLPYLIQCLKDPNAIVRIGAIRCIVELLRGVKEVKGEDLELFGEYIIPHLRELCTDESVAVKCALCQVISDIAEQAFRFLDLSYSTTTATSDTTNDTNDTNSSNNTYEHKHTNLVNTIQDLLLILLSSTESILKQTLLPQIPNLSIHIGKSNTEFLLSHMITVLNHGDYCLRFAFYESVLGVSVGLGRRGVGKYIVPLLKQGLSDGEWSVGWRVLGSINGMIQLGLWRESLLDLIRLLSPFLMSYNLWMRSMVVKCLVSCIKSMNQMEVVTEVGKILNPYLRVEMIDYSTEMFLMFLKEPVDSEMVELALDILPKCISGGRVGGFESGSSKKEEVNESLFREILKDRSVEEETIYKLVLMLPILTKRLQQRGGGRVGGLESTSGSTSGSSNASGSTSSSRTWHPIDEYQLLSSNERISAKLLGMNLKTAFIYPPSAVTPSVAGGTTTGATATGSGNGTTTGVTGTGVTGSVGISGVTGDVKKRQSVMRGSRSVSPELRPRSLLLAQHSDSTSVTTPHTTTTTAAINNTTAITYNTTGKSNTSTAITGSSNSSTSVSPFLSQKNKRPTLSESHTFAIVRMQTDTGAENTTGGTSTSAVEQGEESGQTVEGLEGGTTATATIGSGIGNSTVKPVISSSSSSASTTIAAEVTPLHLRKLIQCKTEEYFPTPVLDLYTSHTSHTTTSHTTPYTSKPYSTTSGNPGSKWTPKGILISNFQTQHQSCINSLKISEDGNFFLSSDRGNMHFWECKRLEKNISNRSRVSYSLGGGTGVGGGSSVIGGGGVGGGGGEGIQKVVFCEGSQSVILAGDCGTFEFLRLEYLPTLSTHSMTQGQGRYSKPHALHTWHISQHQSQSLLHQTREYPLTLETIRGTSLVVYSTNYNQIYIYDLKYTKLVQTLHLESKYGMIRSMCCQDWVLVCGTNRGVIVLWDLRFALVMKRWEISTHGCITKLSFSNTHTNTTINSTSSSSGSTTNGVFVDFICDGNLYTFDIQNEQLVGGTSSQHYDKLGRFLKTLSIKEISSTTSTSLLQTPPPSTPHTLSSTYTGSAYGTYGSSTSGSSSRKGGMKAYVRGEGYMITAGEDCVLRYWDLESIDKSFRISRMKGGEMYSLHRMEQMYFRYEKSQTSNHTGTTTGTHNSTSSTNSSAGNGFIYDYPSTTSNTTAGNGKYLNEQLSSFYEQYRHHQDCIVELLLLQRPYSILVSGSRDGVIKVWK